MWWYILIILAHETGAEGLDQEFDTSQGDIISLCKKTKMTKLPVVRANNDLGEAWAGARA